MNWQTVLIILCSVNVMLAICLVYMGLDIYWRGVDESVENDAEHAKCIAHITEYVGNRFAAAVLNAAADHYGTVEGQAALSRVRYDVWTEDSADSIPALWLRDRAENILEATRVPASD